jgi:hypothetical protein
MSYQGSLQLEKYLVEAELNEALSVITFQFPKWRMYLKFKRVKGKDGGVQEYDFLGKYKDALYMTIDDPKKTISVGIEFSDTNLEQWTDDMIPSTVPDEDRESEKVVNKYWNDPFMKQLKAAVKKHYPKYTLDVGG